MVSNTYAQKSLSNFALLINYGVSSTDVSFKNPFWLKENDNLRPGFGKKIGFEVDQRIFGNFWIGPGMNIVRSNYDFLRVDPYSKENSNMAYLRADKGQEFSMKLQYLKKSKLEYGALFRIKAHKSFVFHNIISTPSGNVIARDEYSSWGTDFRPRAEYGLLVARDISKNKLLSLRFELSYSHFLDVKKSNIIDKINLQTFSGNFVLVKKFKPILE